MSRPLSGHLDDVDLDEVLRVIALARRSGLLDVDGEGGVRAELHFVTGRLVRVRLHEASDTVGQLLVRAGLMTDVELAAGPSDTLDELVARTKKSGLLVRVDDVIAEALDAAVGHVLALRHGSFAFTLTHDDRAPPRYPGDTGLTLPAGVDADELAKEARRRRTERDNDPLAPIGGRRSQVPRPAPRPAAREVIVVDDDPVFLSTVERAFADCGVSVQAWSSARQAIERLPPLFADDDAARALVIDLVMPRANGRGVLGGLEVLAAAERAGVADRVYVAFDDVHDDAAARVVAAGAHVLHKPRAKEALPAFLNPVLARVERPLLSDASVDLASELRQEMGREAGGDDDEWLTDARARAMDDGQQSLETLKALLGELNEPSFEEEIPLLVLRFASAFFVRGALFTYDPGRAGDGSDAELVGLGGFGLGSSDPGRLVRSIRVPAAADTVFARAIAERRGVRQPLWDSQWNTALLTLLGGPRPREVYTAPLCSPRGIECVVYADNATEPRPFPDIALLEIFLQQAAAAIERATLARQLKTLRASQPPIAVS
jgi:CheY-like chemotaxis protein